MERTLLKIPFTRILIPLFLTGCSQIAYTGKIYQESSIAPQYIELSCTYRTEDQKGCVNAVRLSGIPNDGEPDKKLDSGIWWIEIGVDGEQVVKIQWQDGEMSYIPGNRFSIDETDEFFE